MKELSIEEKAKVYDKFVEELKSKFKDFQVIIYSKNDLEKFFPELQESEDERIRKELITHCRNTRCVTEEGAERIAKWIAWLEKQGQTFTKKDVDDAYLKGISDTKNELEKQGEQILANSAKTCKVETKFKVGDKIRRKETRSFDKDMQVARIEKDYYICNHIGKFSSEVVLFFQEDYYELIEQNPAWSEDDDNCLSTIIAEFSKCAGKSVSKDEWMRCNDFLNSLRDRVQSLQKQEWSEEDEKKLLCICAWIKDYPRIADFKDEIYTVANNYIDWLKSLKNRVGCEANFTTAKEWSEEDESNMQNIDSVLFYDKNLPEDTCMRLRNWLKSLKDRVQPRQQWSEEDEQYLLVCKNALVKYQTTDKWDADIISRWLEDKIKSLRPQNHWKPSDEHYELEEFAKIVRCNLTGISKSVQELFEAKYLQLTGNKMYGGFKD